MAIVLEPKVIADVVAALESAGHSEDTRLVAALDRALRDSDFRRVVETALRRSERAAGGDFSSGDYLKYLEVEA